jgi:UMF1 family MFS transporter
MTTVLQIFPIYFVSVAAADLPRAKATERFAFATSAAVILVALLAPVLGALADHTGIKKKLLGGFMLLGSVSTAALYLVKRGDWELGAVVFILGNVGVTGSIVCSPTSPGGGRWTGPAPPASPSDTSEADCSWQ